MNMSRTVAGKLFMTGRYLVVLTVLPAVLAADPASDPARVSQPAVEEPFTFGPRASNLYGNGGEVWSLAFSPDGKALAVASGAGRSPLLGPGHGQRDSTCPGAQADPRGGLRSGRQDRGDRGA